MFLFFTELFPDPPRNITLRTLTANTADITWIRLEDTGDGPLSHYLVNLFQGDKLISNITTNSEAWYFSALRPYTKYSVVVKAGNKHGYGQKTELIFTTNSTGKTSMTSLTTDLVVILVWMEIQN